MSNLIHKIFGDHHNKDEHTSTTSTSSSSHHGGHLLGNQSSSSTTGHNAGMMHTNNPEYLAQKDQTVGNLGNSSLVGRDLSVAQGGDVNQRGERIVKNTTTTTGTLPGHQQQHYHNTGNVVQPAVSSSSDMHKHLGNADVRSHTERLSGPTTVSSVGNLQSSSSVLTTTTTTVPMMQTAMAPLINEDVTKQYMASRNSDVIKELISKMERATLEIDMYAKAQQELVSKEAVELINEVILRTKRLQDSLSGDINSQTQALDLDFQKRREQMLRELDVQKAAQLSAIQQGLQKRQEQLQLDARRQIDEITNNAKHKKLEIVQEAQMKHESLTKNVGQVTSESFTSQKLQSSHVDVSKESLRPGMEPSMMTSTGGVHPNMTRDTLVHGDRRAQFDGRDRT